MAMDSEQPKQVIVTVHKGVLHVQATHGMDKVEIQGMLSIGQQQCFANGVNGWIGGPQLERAPADFLQRLPNGIHRG